MWSGQGLVDTEVKVFRYRKSLVDSNSDKTKSILKKSPGNQENYTKWKVDGYADCPKVQQPEMKDASIKEVKTARVLYDFGAGGDAAGTLSLSQSRRGC